MFIYSIIHYSHQSNGDFRPRKGPCSWTACSTFRLEGPGWARAPISGFWIFVGHISRGFEWIRYSTQTLKIPEVLLFDVCTHKCPDYALVLTFWLQCRESRNDLHLGKWQHTPCLSCGPPVISCFKLTQL